MRFVVTLLAVFGTASLASVARAAGARINYDAPDGCPSPEDFASAVRARGGSVEDSSAPAEREIDVAITAASGGYVGTARVRSGGRSSLARELRAARCSEVADGLAIVTALASQGTNVAETPSGTVETSAPAETPPPPIPPAPRPAPASVALNPRLHTLGQFKEETVAVERGTIGVRNDMALGLSAGALYGILPSTVVPRFDLTFARTNFITTPAGEGFIVGGVLRSRFTLMAPATYRTGEFSTDFLALKTGLSGCSQFVYDLDGFVLLLCGEIAAGVAVFTTKNASGGTVKKTDAGVATAGFEFDARYNLSRLFHLELVAGGEAWVSKLHVDLPDGTELFHTNQFAAYATFGVGVHF